MIKQKIKSRLIGSRPASFVARAQGQRDGDLIVMDYDQTIEKLYHPENFEEPAEETED